MKRLIGFGLFCVALGLVIMMLLPGVFVGTLVVLLCLFVGYRLFCC